MSFSFAINRMTLNLGMMEHIYNFFMISEDLIIKQDIYCHK